VANAAGPDGYRIATPRQRPPLVLVTWAAAVALVLVAPIAWLVRRATEHGAGAFVDTLWRDRTLVLAIRSMSLAAAVTLASVVIGIAAAWLVARSDLIGRRTWSVALGLPLALPSYVTAWGWIGWRNELAGFGGAFVVLTTISYPYVYLPVLGALRRVDPAVEEVARSLGRRPVVVFLTVTLPQLRVAITGGALLVGLYVLSDFGAVSIMRYEALTHVIYRSYRSSFDRTPAAVLGLVLVAIALVVVLLSVRTQHRADRVGSGAVRPQPLVHLGVWRWPLTLAVAVILGLTFGVPARTASLWVHRGRSSADWGDLVDAAVTTLWIGALAAAITVVVALPLGLLSARYPGRLARGTTALAYAAHSLPGIVLALSLVFFGVRVATPLYQRTPMLLFAYLVLFLSLALGAVHHAISQTPPLLDDIARSLGRSQHQAWLAVTMRAAAPGVAVAAAMVCLAVMKELPATLLLRPIGTETLATKLWSHTDAASYAAAAPYAAAILVVAAIPTAVLSAVSAMKS
jgi:iron(III) transport system permease protein